MQNRVVMGSRVLKNLTSQTTYEYQVNHECSTDAWSGWSSSYTFATQNFTAGASASLRSREAPLPLASRITELQLSIFPNPASSTLDVLAMKEFKGDLSSNSTVVVIDQRCRIVKTVRTDRQEKIQLNISDLSDGIYVLRYFDATGSSAVSRFIKI